MRYEMNPVGEVAILLTSLGAGSYLAVQFIAYLLTDVLNLPHADLIAQNHLFFTIMYFGATLLLGTPAMFRPYLDGPQTWKGYCAIPNAITTVVGMFGLMFFLIPNFVTGSIIRPLFTTYQIQVLLFIIVTATAMSSAYFAYRLRCTKRIYYGLLEIVFGIATVIYSAFPVLLGTLSSASALGSNDISVMFIQLMAGIYIIVRGMNNVEDGVKQGHLTARQLFNVALGSFRRVLKLFFYDKQDPDENAWSY